MQNTNYLGHLYAIFCVLVWGSTFISTKVLLIDFAPFEILFTRFILGFLAMCVIMPKFFGFKGIKKELLFALAGLFGVTLYFLLENIALVYVYASIVSVLVVVAPFFTALINHFIMHDEKLSMHFFVGFILSIIGIALISLPSNDVIFNLTGYSFALLAALVWACYLICIKKIQNYGYNTLMVTRRIFAYGILMLCPFAFITDFDFKFELYANKINLFNMLFLGLCASALCFVVWNNSVKLLGVLKASAYIYAIPVVTVVVAVIILDERLDMISSIGIVLTILGLIISESYDNIKNILRKNIR